MGFNSTGDLYFYGWGLRWANDINDVAKIVGGGYYDGRMHGFLLTLVE